jgi:hypothetical protein
LLTVQTAAELEKEQRKLFQGAGRMAGVARLSAAYVIFTSLV